MSVARDFVEEGRLRRERRKAKGRCPSCGRQPAPGLKSCRRCIDRAKGHGRRLRELRGHWGPYTITDAEREQWRGEAVRNQKAPDFGCQCEAPVPASSSRLTRCRRCGSKMDADIAMSEAGPQNKERPPACVTDGEPITLH